MEIFVYIQMGGAYLVHHHHPAAHRRRRTRGAVPRRGAAFKFGGLQGRWRPLSECFLEEDREKLLGVIESSFVDFQLSTRPFVMSSSGRPSSETG